MLFSTPDPRIFEWLGNDSKGVPYYLHPLNLVWSDAGVEHDLELYRRVADQLAGDRGYWAEIIRTAAWRHTLAGCTCLLVSRRHDFFDELCHRFHAGSFVTPQIAVTLGLLHASAARTFFEAVLDEPELRNKPKTVVSAHRVLLRLGPQLARDVPIDVRDALARDDAMLAEQVVAAHWDFWSRRM